MLVNGRFLSRSLTGVDRFAIEVLSSAARELEQNIEFLSPKIKSLSLPPSLQNNSHISYEGLMQGHIWEQIHLATVRPDELLLCLCNTGPILRRRQLVVIHDAITRAQPTNYSFAFRTWYRVLHASLLARASHLATVSKFSASELSRFFGVPLTEIEVIPESGEHILNVLPDRGILQRLGLNDRPFVFAVGSNSPNKNFSAVVDALVLLGTEECSLVVAGGSNVRVFSQLGGDGSNCIRAGYVTDGELRALYESALCFVFPSFYEGFGLPPLEAMTCGCPVIVSNRASMPEVCGDAALYCDPHDPATITRAIRKLLDSKNLVEELTLAGKQHSRQFLWRDAASKLVDLCKIGS